VTRVSEYFQLGRSQPGLDFVDVPVDGDARVYVDPRALRLLPSEWGAECRSLVQNFFHTVLAHIQRNQHQQARGLLTELREPNETRLGLSKGRARGRALGTESAGDVWESLKGSEAVKSGLLEDLEDTILMVEGVADDIVSDITTNIIREPLIRYTQDACAVFGIPTEEVPSGPLWDPVERHWYNEFVDLPTTPHGRLLLVPKVIVRVRMDYSADEYYRHYLLPHLQAQELAANTSLVHLLKDGTPRVTKKAVAEKYGTGKKVIVRETRKSPEVLERYRRSKRTHVRPPLTHEDISEDVGTPEPDWDRLLGQLKAIPVGAAGATDFQYAVEELLSALLYPALAMPVIEHELHEGRKRVDITYTNVGGSGFFAWVAQHYPASHIYVECKNYAQDLENPELDQLQGRFSPSRGKVGLLVCRRLKKKTLFVQRCRDTAQDDRGFIIPLDDEDVGTLVAERKTRSVGFGLLKERFNALIM
jgi:hypothetical protein